jgi:myosin heavy subunit
MFRLTDYSYLLEKTRITHQVGGERNYHIFYQLLAGADDELLHQLDLKGGPESFSYLMNVASTTAASDAEAFHKTVHCLASIGLSPDDQKSIFGMVAAVLHLGNVKFEPIGDDAESARVSEESRPHLTKACELLGIDEARVSEAILTKSIVVDGTSIKKQQNVDMAVDKRDALAKMTYSCLFLWLVQCVNETLSASSTGNTSAKFEMQTDSQGFIGVLDIYGFECFETNGYEQLLINYCNEKLQRHFNRHLFEVEQQLYAAEGVDWSYITFNDNRPCLELIEGGNGVVGILNTLDDAWGGMGSASEKDTKFVSTLHKRFGRSSQNGPGPSSGHQNFVTPKIRTEKQFIVLHYAGEVRPMSGRFSGDMKDLYLLLLF